MERIQTASCVAARQWCCNSSASKPLAVLLSPVVFVKERLDIAVLTAAGVL